MMMYRTISVLLLTTAGVFCAPPAVALGSPLVILNYHDVTEDPYPGTFAVSPGFLRSQIRASRAAGWTFMALSDVLAHLDAGRELPGPVMVLTFDDGHRSFLDLALPILEQEKVPATLAVVNSFVTDPPDDVPSVLSWEQIRALDRHAAIEVASHSDDLHHWTVNNPFHDTSPAVTTRRYLPDQRRYEDRAEYRERILHDMRAARSGLRAELGRDVTTLVWPYGEHNQTAQDLATEAGFRWTLTLGDRPVAAADVAARVLPRFIVTRDTRFPAPSGPISPPTGEVRAAHVDLDELFDDDDQAFLQNVDQLAARISASGATHVILQTCADPKGNGDLGEAWFMNHQLPVKADLWSAAAARFHHAGLLVWARAPVLNLTWAWRRHPDWHIPKDPRLPRQDSWYFRVSPDIPEAVEAARDFYADLAVYLPIDGILFDDDAYMLANEQLARSGVTDPAAKSEAIHAMTDEIMRTVRAWRPEARFGRSLYAPAAEAPGIHPMFSQDLEHFLEDYDLTVVLAYAHREGFGDRAGSWVQRVTRRTLRRWPDEQAAPVLFNLQAYDFGARRWLDDREIRRQVWDARRAGAVSVGVYPVSPDEGPLPERLLSELPRRWWKRP